MASLHRDELATFLRAHRHRLRPADVGLPHGGRRRTPGLRRQEVAQLAGISIDYYIRLEQARGPHPSKQVLGALCRALMLSADEREYLFRMAGQTPPSSDGPSRTVPDGIMNLLATLTENPAYVLDATYEILAVNRLAELFIGAPDGERNIIRYLFTRPGDDSHWDEEHTLRFAQASVADLRAAMARYPGNARIQALVAELLATSPRFARMWDEQHVQVRRSMIKRIDHPIAGPLELDCQVLDIPETDQRLVIYTAPPGSATHQAFRDLAQRVEQQAATGAAR